jgi:hypothetical protein
MKTALVGVLLLLAACGVSAQEDSAAASRANAAAPFSETSAAQVKWVALDTTETDSTTNVATPAEDTSAEPAPSPAAPPPDPKFVFGDRDDYRWQLAVGFDYFRFNSSHAFDTNLFGVNTDLTYYSNSWFGLEGNVITGFSATTYSSGAHAKIFGGLGGIRIGGRRAKWEPWLHALVGGSHLQPQTADGDRNALMALVGGGVDYRVHARLSFRLEADWVYTGYFGGVQNNVQAVASVVLHF